MSFSSAGSIRFHSIADPRYAHITTRQHPIGQRKGNKIHNDSENPFNSSRLFFLQLIIAPELDLPVFQMARKGTQTDADNWMITPPYDGQAMTGTYSFSIDVNRSLATIKIAGFFTRQGVLDFARERDEAFSRLKSAPNQHVTLVDTKGMAIQTQDAVTEFAHVLGEPRYQSRRLAFVVTASLARKQIERAASGRGAYFFRDMQEARDWLLTGENGSVCATSVLCRQTVGQEPPGASAQA